jgi:hypothetical protein
MADEAAVPYGRKTQHAPAIEEARILWIPAGLGCDGDTVSIMRRASLALRMCCSVRRRLA